jgi:hypothetical protein
MFGALFDKSPLIIYPLVGLTIFMVVFIGAVLRAWRRPKAELAAHAALALAEDSHER